MDARQTTIDYADTPASEQSAAFPGTFVSSQPSMAVGAPRDPIIRRAPGDGDEDEAKPISPVQNKSVFVEDVQSAHRRSTSASDSGYDSSAPEAKPAVRPTPASRASSIAPLPVVWNNAASPSQDAHQRAQAMQRSLATDDGALSRSASRTDTFRRASSLRSFRSAPTNDQAAERASVRTTPSVLRRQRRVSLSGGSFSGGAGMVGPASSPGGVSAEFDARSRTAEASLSEKQKTKLNKAQAKEGKKVAKVIKAEGKAEKKALDDAVKELADIQKLQKVAVKEEGKSYASYSKVLREFHKVELEFLAIRTKYERAQAALRAQEDEREAAKQHAQEATEMLQEKNREVEWLRAQKAVDDRERGAKIRQLTGKA